MYKRQTQRRTIDASCFAVSDDAPPHYVDMKHDEDRWKHYFAQLLLCFEVTHDGHTRQCCMVKYVWPDGLGADGEPLSTKYSHTRRSYLEVLDVASVLYRAPLGPWISCPRTLPLPISERCSDSFADLADLALIGPRTVS